MIYDLIREFNNFLQQSPRQSISLNLEYIMDIVIYLDLNYQYALKIFLWV